MATGVVFLAGLVGPSCKTHESKHEELGSLHKGLNPKLIYMPFQEELLQINSLDRFMKTLIGEEDSA